MTREQAKRLLEHIEIVRHFAAGGDLEFAQHQWDGKFVGWRPVRGQMHIACLDSYRIKKPRVRVFENARFERVD